MAAFRKNWITTLGGIMAGLGTLPMLVTASRVAFPLWWNSVQFPLVLTGMLGTILLGVAAKGADEHSTLPQMEASTARAVADDVISQVQAKPSEMPAVKVEIVKGPEDKLQ